MPHGDPERVVVDGRIVRGMLVDLDGTLLNTVGRRSNAIAWLAASQALDERLGSQTGTTPAELAEILGATAEAFWADAERHRWGRLHPVLQRERVVRDALGTRGVDDPELVEALAAAYAADKHRQFHLFPGVVPALAQLRALGLKLVLVTNGEGVSQREKISRFDLARWFDALLIEGDEGVGKPDPEMYRRALAAAHLTAETTIMVGDNMEWEVLVPNQLGLLTVWVNAGGMSWPSAAAGGPWRVVRAFADVPALLQTEDSARLRSAP
ncbi:MAG: HAD family hydrolase [Thermaerobacter sp.]|nr:HAD family hydrolase [Thermaerobacter sp.]